MVQIPGVGYNSIQELFTKGYSGRDNTNIYYSVHHTLPGNERYFTKCEYLYYDIDKVDKTKGWELYLKAVSEALCIPEKSINVVLSGNGYHFLIKLTNNRHFNEDTYFQSLRPYYKKSMDLISAKLAENNIPGKIDMVFDKGRILRVPGTLNEKEGLPTVESSLLQISNDEIDFDLKSVSHLSVIVSARRDQAQVITQEPTLSINNNREPLPAKVAEVPSEVKETIAPNYYEWIGGQPDQEGVLTGCEFLKWSALNQTEVSEPQWYAALSITSRLPDWNKISHAISSNHPKYNARETDEKIQQALQSAGPRTCENISCLWDGCGTCPNNGKVKSPIQLTGPNFIATEQTGFYNIVQANNGRVKHVPNYQDLMKKFTIETPYVSRNEQIYTWDGLVYNELPMIAVENYAYEKMNPKPDSRITAEFRKLITMTNLMLDNQIGVTNHKINLKNGVYDLLSGTLAPHSPKNFFTSHIDCNFEPGATCPNFKSWLEEVCSHDKEKEEALLDYMAYALAGTDQDNELVLILTGEGQNGKSTFMKIMKMLFGTSMSSTTAKKLASPFGKYALENRAICLLEEVPSYKDRDFWEEVKNISSGGYVEIERKFQMPYEHRVRCRLVMTCNKLPGGTDITFGFMRRLLIIPFTYTVPQEQKRGGFEKQFTKEMPGILNELLARIEKLKERGFMLTIPQASRLAAEAYELEKDNIARFTVEKVRIHSEVLPVPKNKVSDVVLYTSTGIPLINIPKVYTSHYLPWCEEEGIKYPETKRAFSINFIKTVKSKVGLEVDQIKSNNGDLQNYVVGGIILK